MFKIIKRIFNIFRYGSGMKPLHVCTAIIGVIARGIILIFLCKSLVRELGITIGILISAGAFIINWFIEYPLYRFSYLETGIFYTSGQNPPLGSILYTLFYFLNCGAIFIIKWFYYSWIYYIALLGYILVFLFIRLIVYIFRD